MSVLWKYTSGSELDWCNERRHLLLSSLMARHEWKTTNGRDWQLVEVLQAAYTTSHFWAEKFSRTKIWILDQLTLSDFCHLSLGNSKNGRLSLCLQTHHTCCQNWVSPVQNDFSAGLKIPHVSGMKLWLSHKFPPMTARQHLHRRRRGKKHAVPQFNPPGRQLITRGVPKHNPIWCGVMSKQKGNWLSDCRSDAVNTSSLLSYNHVYFIWKCGN